MFLRYSRSATDKKYFEEIFDEILNKINKTNIKYEIIYYVKYKTLKIKRIGPTYGNFSMQINMDKIWINLENVLTSYLIKVKSKK